MSYTPLDQHKKAWIFRQHSLPISEEDKAKIKPMEAQRATVFWNTFISKQVDHPDFFKKGDWPFNPNTWFEQGKWEPTWDSDESDLPELILEHLTWPNNTVVYFCNDRQHVIETTWEVFKRCWKNFLFMDDGPLLVGKKRDQAVQFMSNGTFRVGTKVVNPAKTSVQ
ncbi:DUF2947 domain-containing protein [Psychrobium sp. 1_MG-2023]|uniref:DUF2947 domain-containing protein n=1 Tax=Psychrobium sp. 1_MG-2023 TaxID=3062624 RepID=UPI000C32F486|nr:DUF2947 domain-containing protein [Psychrobium sp. 1_MG-2023]MDP2562306.1 DUF2947 domain-containing protein [Psychrobium sp. 1_MG-2023]PKF54689.1 DUF2947 domain-containing protein [Alteromonadales bacterium alter-6D02]